MQWVKQAWEQVKETTIINCFTTCGASSGVKTAEEIDPFTELDQSVETAELNELVCHISTDITADEYLNSDNDLCAYMTIDPERMSSEEWREDLRHEALALCRNEDPCDEEAESDEDEIMEIEEEAAITNTRNVQKTCNSTSEQQMMKKA